TEKRRSGPARPRIAETLRRGGGGELDLRGGVGRRGVNDARTRAEQLHRRAGQQRVKRILESAGVRLCLNVRGAKAELEAEFSTLAANGTGHAAQHIELHRTLDELLRRLEGDVFRLDAAAGVDRSQRGGIERRLLLHEECLEL